VALKTLKDTIAAISTPLGEGGIGIVRISGPKSIALVQDLFRSSSGRNIHSEKRRVYHGVIIDEQQAVVDEVLVHIMRTPHSYTREDVVEINCHGGTGPLNAVLELALRKGARLSQPGEFTQRAFLNGRIDLTQAEAVIDRIRARTRASLRAAGAAASGVLSSAINEIKETLVNALARVEASVDFPDEDLPELVGEDLRTRLTETRDRMKALLDTAETGRLYREGARIAIAGRPNVGKSSLFNALLRDARAIVSAQPGTTRDRIEEMIALSGVPVRLTDTAGLHSSEDEIERMGIGVARDTLRNADMVLLVLDISESFQDEDTSLAAELEALDVPVWVALNKIDLGGATEIPPGLERFAGVSRVSAKTGEGLVTLEEKLGELLLGGASISPDEGMITRAHQRDSFRRAMINVDRVLDDFGASPELLSIELREAVQALGEITGETTPEDVLETIFSTFCIGK